MRTYNGFTYFTQGANWISPERPCTATVEGEWLNIDFNDMTDASGYLQFTGAHEVQAEGVYGYRSEDGIDEGRHYRLLRHDMGEQIILFGEWRDRTVEANPKHGGWVLVLISAFAKGRTSAEAIA